ncbi:MAG: dihydrolipoamide acetyltransferase family protein [Planctomycetota bacterium]
MANEIKLPALKENVEVVEVNAIKVGVGDVVAKDQALLEVQADKAALEVPSPLSGKVVQILVKVGDQVKIGQPFIQIDGAGVSAAPAPKAEAKPAPAAAKAPAPSPVPSSAPPAPATHAPTPAPVAVTTPPAPQAAAPVVFNTHVVASPGTRRLAREMGIDLTRVAATGPGGRLTEDDLKNHVRAQASGGGSSGVPSAPPLPRFEELGPVERQPLSAIRRATARQMAIAWSQIPHVTLDDVSDITDLEAFRKSQDGKGPKLTVTAFALKALAIALREFPAFNSSLDLQNNHLVLKKFINIGVAVDTEAGLLVPVVRDVDKKSVRQLATDLTAIAERARAKKLDSSELTGGTFTLTNLGGIGSTGFTPIVNWPEVAILGLSRGRLEPVWKNGAFVPRLMVPLSLSFDHRVIDGAAAGRFTRRVADLLENPLSMLVDA